MKRSSFIYGFLLVIAVGMGLLFTRLPVAASPASQDTAIPTGGALYDKWYAVLGIDPPDGSQPIWARQTRNTLSGPDTWRCVTCHGWDYQGKDGAYRSGTNFTGFPSILPASQQKSVDELVNILKGNTDPAHDFSKYIDDSHLHSLAEFLKNALIDDNEYIDLNTLEVKNGNAAHGQQLYDQACAECHGADGKQLVLRFEGTRAYLGALAVLDPWRFLHKTRFGTPGTPMVIGYHLGWTPQDGRDVLLYAQSLPASQAPDASPPPLGSNGAATTPGATGPANNGLTGILTALGVLAGIILLLIWTLRRRK